MTTESKQEMYFGGVPTDPEIRRLRDEYPEGKLEEGQFIAYDEVEKIIQCNKNAARFKTVTNRWRGIVERESGKVIGTRPGEGFVVLSDEEKVDMSGGKLRTAARQTRRSMVVSLLVDRRKLDETARQRLDHIDAVNARLSETARLASKGDLPKLTE